MRGIDEGFASPRSAREELRLQISSMMTGDRLRIGHDPPRHAAYVGSRIRVLRDDPTEIYRASQDARVMSDYLLDRTRHTGPHRETEAAPGRERPVPQHRRGPRGAPGRSRRRSPGSGAAAAASPGWNGTGTSLRPCRGISWSASPPCPRSAGIHSPCGPAGRPGAGPTTRERTEDEERCYWVEPDLCLVCAMRDALEVVAFALDELQADPGGLEALSHARDSTA